MILKFDKALDGGSEVLHLHMSEKGYFIQRPRIRFLNARISRRFEFAFGFAEPMEHSMLVYVNGSFNKDIADM
jgi:hypothetical protein